MLLENEITFQCLNIVFQKLKTAQVLTLCFWDKFWERFYWSFVDFEGFDFWVSKTGVFRIENYCSRNRTELKIFNTFSLSSWVVLPVHIVKPL